MEIENQYPIGKLELQDFSSAVKERALGDIRFLPNALEAAITNLVKRNCTHLIEKVVGRYTSWCIMWRIAISMLTQGLNFV
ncbi:DinB family protein [Niabella ginsengisoli]|uniref:Uncharacterized protein n=1 Tax=Niabella ginsengisoli TaxID=522298 RepID=A0ABS9SGW8_9BACT|nr:hypothetical protein [Niabella ginsengisoli]MCH5597608.1 hypothetical protein [Niabella ginsengisoli]